MEKLIEEEMELTSRIEEENAVDSEIERSYISEGMDLAEEMERIEAELQSEMHEMALVEAELERLQAFMASSD